MSIKERITEYADSLVKVRKRGDTELTLEQIAQAYADAASWTQAEIEAEREASELVTNDPCNYCDSGESHPPEACTRVPNDIIERLALDSEFKHCHHRDTGVRKALPTHVQAYEDSVPGGLTTLVGKCVKVEPHEKSYIKVVTIAVPAKHAPCGEDWHVVTMNAGTDGDPHPRIGDTVDAYVEGIQSTDRGHIYTSYCETWDREANPETK